MIGHLSGNVLKVRGKKLILDVAGVGYEVSANSKTLLGVQMNDPLRLWIHTHQTNDAISLFGFAEESDLRFFELLISVNGVGPRTALDILETPAEVLEKIILESDTKKLAEAPGVGKKTAARIVLELKPKITGGDPEVPIESEINDEILEAVIGLGYSRKEAQKVLTKLPPKISEMEEVVRWFLQNA